MELRKNCFPKLITLALCAGLLLFSAFGFSQLTVTGTVTDIDGNVIPGANVVEKGTANGVSTDFDGNYSISVASDATLEISYIGFVKQEVAVSGRSTINVTLMEDVTGLDEVVVIGYGAVEKKSLTSSVAQIGSEDLIPGFNLSAEQAIQGKIAGLNISQGDGAPGAGSRINIRGLTSLAANTQPLFIVDGVAIGIGGAQRNDTQGQVTTSNPFDFINPNDIENVSVLKGPSAIAIYGARGANGVIIITTKSGQTGRSYVELNAVTTITTPGKFIETFSADELRDLSNELGFALSDFGENTNFQDEVLSSALSTQYNLSAGGGNEKSTYFGSLSWTDEIGTLIGTDNKRLTGRIRYTQKAFDDRLTFDLNANYATNSTDLGFTQVNGGGSATPPVIGQAVRFNPTAPVRNPDGSFFEVAFPNRESHNPVAVALQQQDNNLSKTFGSQLNLGYDVIKDKLNVKGTFAIISNSNRRNLINPPNSQRGAAQGNGFALVRDTENFNLTGEAFISYKETFGENHNFDALVGYSYQEIQNEGVQVSQTNLLSDFQGVNIIGVGDPLSVQTSVFEGGNNLRGWIGRINYDFAKKYFFTGVIRRDISGAFAFGEPVGDFPSFAGAWRISEEEFMQDSWLSELKLRAEWGQVGNNSIPGLQTVSTFSFGFSGALPVNPLGFTFGPNQIGNANLTWETTTTTNFGLDFGFAKGRISGTIDWYNKVTSDLFRFSDVPAPTTDGSILINGGELQNTGVELALNANIIQTEDVSFSLSLIGAYNKNEIKELNDAGGNPVEFETYGSLFGASFVGDEAFRLEVGLPSTTIYGVRFAGVNQDGLETYFTEDGSVTDNITEAEETVLGNSLPDLTMALTPSFRYKNFDMSAQFRGAFGAQLINNTVLEWGQPTYLAAGFNIPKAGLDEANVNLATVHEFSDRFVDDADFVRLENLTIGYNFDTSRWTGINKLRLYFSGRNLFVITGYDGPGDPETFSDSRTDTAVSSIFGVDYLSYQRPKIYSLGLNVNF